MSGVRGRAFIVVVRDAVRRAEPPGRVGPIRRQDGDGDRVSDRIYDILNTSGIGGYLIATEALTWVLRDMRATWAAADEGQDAAGET